MSTSPTGPTRSDAAALAAGIVVSILIAFFVMPTSEARWALLIGVAFGLALMAAVWLHEAGRGDTGGGDGPS